MKRFSEILAKISIVRLKFFHSLKPFTSNGFSPSPLERGWGEVKPSLSNILRLFSDNNGLKYKHRLENRCNI